MKLKTGMKKGFTLVELLFVMAIIAILAGFAIANLQDSTKTAITTSMKNDARNAIAAEQTAYANEQEYGTANCNFKDLTNGICSLTGTNDSKVGTTTVSKGNEVVIETSTCDNGVDGYSVTVTNSQVNDKSITYNSCTNSAIQTTALTTDTTDTTDTTE